MSEAPRRRKGWHPDPFGFYKERYYYLDDKPGRLVRNEDRVEAYSDIPEWAQTQESEEAPPARLRFPTPPVPGIAAAVETEAGVAEPTPVAYIDEPRDIGVAAAAVTAASPTTAPATAEDPLSRNPRPDDYFPDEPVRWRTQIAGRMAWIRRAPRPSRRTWYIIGAVGFAIVLGAVLFAVVPGSDHTPASAQLTPNTNPQPTVPGNFLNGTRGETPAANTPTSTTTTITASTTTTNKSTTTSVAPAASVRAWTLTQSFGISALSLNAVTCPTATQCYAVGQTTFKTGMVLASSDGGGTWAQHNVPAGVASLAAIACSSGTTCVAVGGTSVITSSDGGVTWAAKTMGQNALTTVSCPSSSDCVVGGSDAPTTSGCASGHTYETSNGGLSWQATATHCFVPSGVACSSSSHCVLVGTHSNATKESGEILTSQNGGSAWQSRYVLSQDNTQLNGVSCPTTRSCVAVGNSSSQSILISLNGGDSWTKSDPGVPVAQRYFLAVGCGSAQECNAGGSAGPVTTTNGGGSWTAVSGSSITKITGISCASTTTCVGVAVDSNNAPAIIKLT